MSSILLSLGVAWALFKGLSSEGVFAFGPKSSFGGAAAGFFATLLIIKSWYGKLEFSAGLEKDPELVKSIANLLSTDLVRSSAGDPIALTTLYNETRQYLPVQFRSLGDPWCNALLNELTSEIQLVARAVDGLREWTPSLAPTALIEEVNSE